MKATKACRSLGGSAKITGFHRFPIRPLGFNWGQNITPTCAAWCKHVLPFPSTMFGSACPRCQHGISYDRCHDPSQRNNGQREWAIIAIIYLTVKICQDHQKQPMSNPPSDQISSRSFLFPNLVRTSWTLEPSWDHHGSSHPRSANCSNHSNLILQQPAAIIQSLFLQCPPQGQRHSDVQLLALALMISVAGLKLCKKNSGGIMAICISGNFNRENND